MLVTSRGLLLFLDGKSNTRRRRESNLLGAAYNTTMHTTLDLAALHAAVCDDPADVGVRLVYADALEERNAEGDAERAEFIRVQIELSKAGRCRGLPAASCDLDVPPLCPVCRLRHREQELHCGGGQWLTWLAFMDRFPFLGAGVVEYRRGFVEAVRLPAALWLTHADALTAAAPITEVVLTTTPEVSGWGGLMKLAGREKSFRDDALIWDETEPSPTRYYTMALLAAEWPRIRFALPA